MTIDELEKRIRALEDIEEIQQLQRRYMYLLDNHEWGEVLNCFAENAQAQIRNGPLRKGKKEIAELYEGRGAKSISWNDAHFVGQPVIELEGDGNRVKGKWNVCMLFAESVRWVQGRNECEYIKENGKWKFYFLRFRRIKAAPPSLAP
jgi:hypothetical protein